MLTDGAHMTISYARLLTLVLGCGGEQYAFNLFSHNSPMTSNGYNEEEMKMVKETKKIWNDPEVHIMATCIRVPIMRAHAESINLELENSLTEEQVSGTCSPEVLRSFLWEKQLIAVHLIPTFVESLGTRESLDHPTHTYHHKYIQCV
jgi:aspartate-semialdehyde dehydrogenase